MSPSAFILDYYTTPFEWMAEAAKRTELAGEWAALMAADLAEDAGQGSAQDCDDAEELLRAAAAALGIDTDR